MYSCSPAQYTDLQMAQRIGILSVLAANCSCLPQVNLLQQINLVRLQQQCGCPGCCKSSPRSQQCWESHSSLLLSLELMDLIFSKSYLQLKILEHVATIHVLYHEGFQCTLTMLAIELIMMSLACSSSSHRSGGMGSHVACSSASHRPGGTGVKMSLLLRLLDGGPSCTVAGGGADLFPGR